ncbi:ATP-binding protein [Lewinella sp. 4G2]|uniref:ATP-binding protein n=1 Tax=Lewinella sp. 4G2 TaxID=1803372 RepID=UPI0018D489E1|nr:ATP-binding protein [Lewinella sp. 4G2]
MVFWCTVTAAVAAQEEQAYFELSGAQYATAARVQPSQKFLKDADGILSVNDVLGLSGPDSVSAWSDRPALSVGDYLWTKTIFRNSTDEPRSDYVVFHCCASEVSAHIIRQSGERTTFKGKELAILPTEPVAITLNTQPGEVVTVLHRARVTESRVGIITGTLYVTEATTHLNITSQRYGDGYFISGFLICLMVVTLIVYLLFRERTFMYLLLLLFGFFNYFYFQSQISGLLPSYDQIRMLGINAVNLSGGLIVAGMTGFLYYYLDLPTRFPRAWRFYVGWTVFTLFFSAWFSIISLEIEVLFVLSNITTMGWVVASIGLTIAAAWNGGRPERVLLASTGLLALATVVFIINIITEYRSPLIGRLFEYAFLIFTSLLFYGVYDKVSTVNTEARQLKDQFTFRSRFFANITHEFRTPLTLILGPLRQLLDREPPAADRELLQIAHRNAERQLQLVNQILDLSDTKREGLRLQLEAVDTVQMLRRLTYSYASLAEQHEIDLQFKASEDSLVTLVDREKLETIVYNLLTNAFKFTLNGGEIGVTLQREENDLVIKVRDTGVGIPKKALAHVFERYYSDQRKSREGTFGNGIGLALTKELVLLHGGQISVESEEELETVFTVRLPYKAVSTTHSSAPARAPKNDAELALGASALTENYEEESLPTGPVVLIVEDNADMRTYLRIGLSGSYRVEEARDGREGTQMAKKLLPDLIISDVMMPEMDGFELCADLKTSLETSHIPIILLTARAAAQDRIQGLDTGADDYLTKPFEVPELRARARNLISGRRLLRERFAESLTLKPEEVTASSVDQEFLLAAVQAVEDNMENENFGIDELALQLGVSRPSMNKKFRALLDQSSNQFLQSIRLERAADMLLKTQDTVAMIADAVGFRSASYFIKSFRDKFSMTPGQYRKNGGADAGAR